MIEGQKFQPNLINEENFLAHAESLISEERYAEFLFLICDERVNLDVKYYTLEVIDMLIERYVTQHNQHESDIDTSALQLCNIIAKLNQKEALLSLLEKCHLYPANDFCFRLILRPLINTLLSPSVKASNLGWVLCSLRDYISTSCVDKPSHSMDYGERVERMLSSHAHFTRELVTRGSRKFESRLLISHTLLSLHSPLAQSQPPSVVPCPARSAPHHSHSWCCRLVESCHALQPQLVPLLTQFSSSDTTGVFQSDHVRQCALGVLLHLVLSDTVCGTYAVPCVYTASYLFSMCQAPCTELLLRPTHHALVSRALSLLDWLLRCLPPASLALHERRTDDRDLITLLIAVAKQNVQQLAGTALRLITRLITCHTPRAQVQMLRHYMGVHRSQPSACAYFITQLKNRMAECVWGRACAEMCQHFTAPAVTPLLREACSLTPAESTERAPQEEEEDGGGPGTLIEQSPCVLAALNTLRFLLIADTADTSGVRALIGGELATSFLQPLALELAACRRLHEEQMVTMARDGGDLAADGMGCVRVASARMGLTALELMQHVLDLVYEAYMSA